MADFGPNMKKLVARKMSMDAVPPGGGIQSALDYLSNPDTILRSSRAAKQWCRDAVDAMRGAPEPNPWRNATDEEIAGEILDRIQSKRKTMNFMKD